MVDYRPEKEDPNRVRITAGQNLMRYPGELTTRAADMRTSNIIRNSVISTFYLATPMECKKYVQLTVKLIPQEFMDTYNLHSRVKNRYVY